MSTVPFITGDTHIVSTKLRCPKCGSRDLFLVESGTWTTEWTVTAGKFDRKKGYHNPEGIDRLDAKCRDCDHTWKPRGTLQIDDVVEGFEP